MSEQVLAILPIEDDLKELMFIDGGNIDPVLEKIREQAKDLPFDMSIKKNRDEVASFAYKIARSKTAVEKAGAAISAKYKEIPKKIDASRRQFKETFEELQREVRQPLDSWEAEEQARIDNCKAVIIGMEKYEECEELSSSELELSIQALTDTVINEALAEFENEAHQVKQAMLAKLNAQLNKKRAEEAQQAELEELRKQTAEREQKEREEAIAREAEAKAKAEAEEQIARAKFEAEQAEIRYQNEIKQAALEKEAAELRAIQSAENARLAEVKRVQEEQAALAQEAAKREADTKHKGAINRQAVADLMQHAGLDDKQARAVVAAIVKKQISSVSIFY